MEVTLDKIESLLKDITPPIVQTVSCAGLIGNLLSAIVLCRSQMRNSHLNILLLGLTFADGLYLTINLVSWSDFVPELDPYIKMFSYLFAQTSSVYFTLVISIERLIVIYWPFKARALFTISTSKWILAFAFSFNLLISLPEFLAKWMEEGGPYLQFYFNYWMWISFFIRMPIPFLSLIILNTLIYIKLRQADKERGAMRNQVDESASAAEENSITKMLMCVVVVFGICYSFGFPRSLAWYWFWLTWSSPSDTEFKRSQSILWILSCLDDIATCVNSSANFIIYIGMGKKFRDEFNQIVSRIFRCTKSNRQPEIVALGAVRIA